MDKSTLAQKMLLYEQKKIELDVLGAEIQAAVLEIGDTFVVGNVRATYNHGKRTFDYETPGRLAPADLVAQYTKTITTTDWRSVCKEAQIDPVVVSQDAPFVTIKIQKE